MSEYAVLTYEYKEGEIERDLIFQRVMFQVTKDTSAYLMAHPHLTPQAPIAEVRIYPNITGGGIPEYDQYSSVYFLNQVAVDLCRECGLSLEYKGLVSYDVVKSFGYLVNMPYLPSSKR